jgi:hypothetical protein
MAANFSSRPGKDVAQVRITSEYTGHYSMK